MKLDKVGSTDVVGFPIEETEKVIKAMELAEKAGDLKALQWCARRLSWLYEASDVIGSDDMFYPARIFNPAWEKQLKDDPAPDSIAAIMNRMDETEPITATDAGKALDTVKAFFEENMAKKKLSSAFESLDALRAAVEATEGKE